jgi:oxygen-independent coproporphyrinogen-3 oxidase
MPIEEVVEHVYVHVPFCPTICPFCSFEVLERRAGAVDAYLDRLEADAAAAAIRCDVRPSTLYLGGGTPSYLRVGELARLCRIIDRHLGWPTDEVTLELHPSTVTAERVAAWVDLGVTRLSVGVESTDDAVLRRLGRSHDATTARAALDLALGSGLEVSADLMTAIDGQDVTAELDRLVATGVPHVSAYVLTIEDDTPFARDGVEVDVTAEWEALEVADDVLGRAGFTRYEVSNHARPGHQCRHNLAYWDNRCWVGLGPGAHGHEPAGSAALTVRRAEQGWSEWLAGAPPELEPRDGLDWAVDAVVAGLRRRDGIDLDELTRRSGIDVAAVFAAAIDLGHRDGHLASEGSRLWATSSGARVLDQVAAAFVAPDRDPIVTRRGRDTSEKKSLPLSSTTMKAGKSTTSIFHTASMPSSG